MLSYIGLSTEDLGSSATLAFRLVRTVTFFLFAYRSFGVMSCDDIRSSISSIISLHAAIENVTSEKEI